MTSANSAFHFFRPGAVLRVTGEDAFTFLQGQFSNQLQHPVGSAVYGLWLNQKGKVLADSTALRLGENEFLLVSMHVAAAVIRERLESYVIADDVVVADETSAFGGLSVNGVEGSSVVKAKLGALPESGKFVWAAGMLAWAGRLPGEVIVLDSEASVATLAKGLSDAGVVELDAAAAESRRIEAGVPAVPADIGPGDLPNEGGLDETAVSYTKGCYLGQEVMARLKNLGQVRRKLLRVRGAGVPPAGLAGLYQGNEKVGEFRSVAPCERGFVALAMCSLVKLKAGAGLSLSPEGPIQVELADHG